MKTMFYLAAGLGVLFASEAFAESTGAHSKGTTCTNGKCQDSIYVPVKRGPRGKPVDKAKLKKTVLPEVHRPSQKPETSVRLPATQTQVAK